MINLKRCILINFSDKVMMSKIKRKFIDVINRRKDFFTTLTLGLSVAQ